MKKYFKTKNSVGYIEGSEKIINSLNLNKEEEKGSGGPLYFPDHVPEGANTDYLPPTQSNFPTEGGSGGPLPIPGIELEP